MKLTAEQVAYRRRRQGEVDKIDRFVIYFGNIGIECRNDEDFIIFRGGDAVKSVDVKIDVYDLRVGDEVAICGSQGRVTKIEEVLR